MCHGGEGVVWGGGLWVYRDTDAAVYGYHEKNTEGIVSFRIVQTQPLQLSPFHDLMAIRQPHPQLLPKKRQITSGAILPIHRQQRLQIPQPSLILQKMPRQRHHLQPRNQIRHPRHAHRPGHQPGAERDVCGGRGEEGVQADGGVSQWAESDGREVHAV